MRECQALIDLAEIQKREGAGTYAGAGGVTQEQHMALRERGLLLEDVTPAVRLRPGAVPGPLVSVPEWAKAQAEIVIETIYMIGWSQGILPDGSLVGWETGKGWLDQS